jgi:hypothetical protein
LENKDARARYAVLKERVPGRERPASSREKAGFTLAEGAVAPSQRNRDVSLHRTDRIPRELNLRSGADAMPTNQ